jgi:hypothetical protein
MSNPRAHAARARCMEKIYGNFTKIRARAPRARHAAISSRPSTCIHILNLVLLNLVSVPGYLLNLVLNLATQLP